MIGEQFRTDQRAASITVHHALTLGITAMLITGLLLGAADMADRQQNSAVRMQLTDIGGTLASQIHAADQLNETGTSVNATLRTELPRRVAGVPYQVSIDPSRAQELHLYTDNPSVVVRFSVETETELADDVNISSEALDVQLCSGSSITVGRSC